MSFLRTVVVPQGGVPCGSKTIEAHNSEWLLRDNPSEFPLRCKQEAVTSVGRSESPVIDGNTVGGMQRTTKDFPSRGTASLRPCNADDRYREGALYSVNEKWMFSGEREVPRKKSAAASRVRDGTSSPTFLVSSTPPSSLRCSARTTPFTAPINCFQSTTRRNNRVPQDAAPAPKIGVRMIRGSMRELYEGPHGAVFYLQEGGEKVYLPPPAAGAPFVHMHGDPSSTTTMPELRTPRRTPMTARMQNPPCTVVTSMKGDDSPVPCAAAQDALSCRKDPKVGVRMSSGCMRDVFEDPQGRLYFMGGTHYGERNKLYLEPA